MDQRPLNVVKCPGCAAYLHYDRAPVAKRCWKCRMITDIAAMKSAQDSLIRFVGTRLNWFFLPITSVSRLKIAGKWAFVIALLISLLVSASFMLYDAEAYLKTPLHW